MSAINVNSITGRTGTHGPVLTGVTTATNGLNITGGTVTVGTAITLRQNGNGDFSGVILSGVDPRGGGGTGVYVDGPSGAIVAGATGSNAILRGFQSGSSENFRFSADGSGFVMGNVGIGTDNTGAGLLSVHKGTSGANYINITNSVTGPASWANGMLLGNNGSGDALVWQNEYLNMRFGTNNTDRMTLTEDGDIGIGITDPSAQLHVVDSSATTTDCLKLRNYASSVNSQPSITFEAVTSAGQGANSHIRGIAGTEAGGLSNQNASGIQFDVRYGGGGTLREAAKFTTDGNLAFPSGQGIDFSATSGGSGTATSELLDDYEEGSFLPTAFGNTTSGTTTYGLQYGHYIKVGSLVHIQIRMTVSTATGTGPMAIGNLPYISLTSSTSGYAAINIPYASQLSFGGSGTNYLGAYTVENTNYMLVFATTSGAAITSTPMDSSFTVIVGGTYATNS